MPLIAQDSWVSRQLLGPELPEEVSEDGSASSSAPAGHELSSGAAARSCRAWRLGAVLCTLGLAVTGVALSRSLRSQRHTLRMPLQLYDIDEAWACMELGNGLDAEWCASAGEQAWVREKKGLIFRWFQDAFEKGVQSPCGNCWCCFRDAPQLVQAPPAGAAAAAYAATQSGAGSTAAAQVPTAGAAAAAHAAVQPGAASAATTQVPTAGAAAAAHAALQPGASSAAAAQVPPAGAAAAAHAAVQPGAGSAAAAQVPPAGAAAAAHAAVQPAAASAAAVQVPPAGAAAAAHAAMQPVAASAAVAQAAVTPAPRALELIEVEPASPVSLYCWSVIRTSGYEPTLMSLQHSRGVGIFACEGHQVFATTTGNVGGVDTIGLGDDPTRMCNWENRVFYACNTKMFIKAWEKIVELGDYLHFSWTVKVDPDAGFFPDRLKQRLPQVWGDQRLFVQNADFPKMLGPLEVVSQAAVTQFGAARQGCYDKFDEDVTGEDGYFSDCFSTVVGAEAHEDRGVLDNSGSAWNCAGGAACVHAFKDQGALAECYDHAR